MTDPLPDLSAGNFRSRRVFHQIENRHRTTPSQPRFEVLHADADIRAQSLLRNRFTWSEIKKVLRGKIDIVALAVDLVWLRHKHVASIERQLHHAGMRYPGPVVSIACLAFLVRPDLGERFLVRLWIILHWNLRRHPAHRKNIATMTSLDAEQRIRMHEMRPHCDELAVGQKEIRFVPKFFDAGENVIPATAV